MSDREFQKFLKSYESPSKEVDLQTLGHARSYLQKEERFIVVKAFVLHALAGLATLAMCPQFGFSPFKASETLPHLFMAYGTWACGAFCAAIFMGAGTLLKMLAMKERELRIYQRKSWSRAIGLGLAFFTLLALLGDNSDGIYLGVGFALSWLLTAIVLEAAPNAMWARFQTPKAL